MERKGQFYVGELDFHNQGRGGIAKRLEKKVAIITGGASGIGRGIALRFGQEGADIVIADIDLSKANSVAEEIKALGRKAIAVKVNVSRFSEAKRMVRQTIAKFGKVDILVNCAGVSAIRALLPEMTEQDWDRVIGINLKGYFNCSLFVSREMVKQKKGKIINIGSIASYTNTPGQVAYGTAKGGVNAFTRATAIDLAPYKINVNVIAPGNIDTPMFRKRCDPKEVRKRNARIAFGHPGKVEDIAGAAVFLASEDSNHMTGSILVVDGGEIINRTYR